MLLNLQLNLFFPKIYYEKHFELVNDLFQVTTENKIS